MKSSLRSGFTLSEVLVALSIFAFSVTLLFALLPLSIKTSKNSSTTVKASSLLETVEGDLRMTAIPGSKTPLFDFIMPTQAFNEYVTYFTRNNQLTGENEKDVYYRVTSTIRYDERQNLYAVNLKAEWPARSINATGNAEGSTDLFTYIEAR